eukprot:COSAG01_NODE_1206_length_11242_cov_29.405905_15_plen_79_part_00
MKCVPHDTPCCRGGAVPDSCALEVVRLLWQMRGTRCGSNQGRRCGRSCGVDGREAADALVRWNSMSTQMLECDVREQS